MKRDFEKLGMRRWKRDKRYGMLILFLMAISFFLMEFTFLISDSLEATLAERRKEAYGDWQYALLNIPEEEISHARQNPFLKQSGLLWTADTLKIEESGYTYGIGGGDSDGVSMARIHMTDGRLPEKEGEAAIEETALNKLASGAAVGDMITLEVPSDYAQDNGYSLTVRLCGILSDYTPNWCINGRVILPSIWITEETAETLPGNQEYILLLNGIPEWNTMEQDLRNDEIISVVPYENEYLFGHRQASTVENAMNLLRWIGGALAFIILSLTVTISTKQRREEWQVLSLLGAKKEDLMGILMREFISFSLLALTIGVGAALAAAKMILLLFSEGIGETVSYGFSWIHLLIAMGLGMSVTAFAYLIPIFTLRKYVDLSPRNLQQAAKTIPKRRWKIAPKKDPTFWSVLTRQWFSRPGLLAAKWILMTCMLAIPCLGIFLVRDQEASVSSHTKNYGNSYVFDAGYRYTESAGVRGIPIKKAQDLLNIYGIEGMEAYRMTDPELDGFTANLTNYAESEYFQLNFSQMELAFSQRMENGSVLENTSTEKFSPAQSPISIWTLGEKEQERFFQNLEEGEQVNPQAFSQGKEVILVVPALLKTPAEDGLLYPSLDRANWAETLKNGGTICMEETAQVGDILSISSPVNAEVEVRVTGILSSIDEKADYIPTPYTAYTILTGEGFWERFPEWDSASRYQLSRYQYVQYQASFEADEATDQQMSRAAAGVSTATYENHREIQAGLERDFILTVGFCTIICGMLTFLLIFILRLITQTEQKAIKKTLQLLYDLGMEASWSRFYQLIPAIALSIGSIGIATIGLSWYHTNRINAIIKDLGDSVPFILRLGMDEKLFIFICVIHFALCLGFSSFETSRKK